MTDTSESAREVKTQRGVLFTPTTTTWGDYLTSPVHTFRPSALTGVPHTNEGEKDRRRTLVTELVQLSEIKWVYRHTTLISLSKLNHLNFIVTFSLSREKKKERKDSCFVGL